MPSYDWTEFADATWSARFPDSAVGADPWRDLPPLSQWSEQSPLDVLPDIRERDSEISTPLRRPRVFVSHRQVDRDWALRVAFLATQERFDFWLDVLDPDLQALEQQRWGRLRAQEKAIATALIIEMALLNSTHIIVLVTPNSRGSLWIPYEYGRAKEAPPLSLQAGCWKHPELSDADFPEYLQLGITTHTEDEIRSWLGQQRELWQARYARAFGGTSGGWRNTQPSPLPR